MSQEQDKELTPEQIKTAIQKIVEILGIDESGINYIPNSFSSKKYFSINNKTINKEIVFRELSEHPLKFENCIFKEGVNFIGATFEKELNFSTATFKEKVNFGGATFKEKIRFSKTTFEKEIDFDGATFEKEVNFSTATFKEKVNFGGATFEKEIDFDGATFEKELNFSTATFKEKVNFGGATFKEKIRFSKTTFEKEIYFIGATFEKEIDFIGFTFEKEIDFSVATFEKEVNFSVATFEKEVNFNGATFEKEVNFKEHCEFKAEAIFSFSKFKNGASFSNSKFLSGAYFNEVTFCERTDFHECEFEKVACFYGTTFNEAPNFSQAIFKGSLNLVNAKLNFDFENLEIKIREECEKYNKNLTSKKEKKPLEYFANNFRDSFRFFKSALIKENNLLDASNFHRVELYCKEIELETILEIQDKAKNKINKNENSKQPIEKIKMEKITRKKLQFILKNITNLLCYMLCQIMEYIASIICNIAVLPIKFICYAIKKFYHFFCSLLYAFFILFDSQGKEKFKRYVRYKTIKFKRLGKNMLDFTTWTNCLLLKIYRNTSDHHTNFVKILNFSIGMIALYAVLNFVLNVSIGVLLPYTSVVNVTSFYALIIISLLFIFHTREEMKIFHSYAFVIVLFISAVLFFEYIYLGQFSALFLMFYFLVLIIFYALFISKIKIVIFILRLFSYLIFLLIIVLKPQLVNPFVGVFASDKLFESKLEQKLNELNSSTIINLAKISQKDFDLKEDYNISFTELNSAKTFIMANKNELYEILSEILDEKNKYDFKIILNTLENNSSILSNTIKSIDAQNKNHCIFATLRDFLKLNFGKNSISNLGYCVYEEFTYLSIKPKNQEYEIFNSKENQDKLRNILSIINFDKNLKLTEIKEAINYDEILSGAAKSTGVVYSIILLLCIFSLQKTTRKNSIVPN